MSHWFKIQTTFKSKAAIKAAAEQLGYQLRYRTYCRGFAGQLKPCDLVLALPGEYDLGFNQQQDGSYSMVADFWMDHISNYLADPSALQKAHDAYPDMAQKQGQKIADEMLNNVKIGRFKQAYNLHASLELARNNGLQYSQSVLEDGTIQLRLTGEPIMEVL